MNRRIVTKQRRRNASPPRDELARRAWEAERAWRPALAEEQARSIQIVESVKSDARLRAALAVATVDEAAGDFARATLADADRARAESRELERLRPRHEAMHLLSAMKELPLHRWNDHSAQRSIIADDENPATHVGVVREHDQEGWVRLTEAEQEQAARLARLLQGERACESIIVRKEVRDALENAAARLADIWISLVAEGLAHALEARLTQNRNHVAPGAFASAAHVLAYARGELRAFDRLSVLPTWLTTEHVSWLLDHYSPTAANRKGGGGRPRKGDVSGKLNDASIRALLKNRHDLEKKIAASDPALAARIRLEK